MQNGLLVLGLTGIIDGHDGDSVTLAPVSCQAALSFGYLTLLRCAVLIGPGVYRVGGADQGYL